MKTSEIIASIKNSPKELGLSVFGDNSLSEHLDPNLWVSSGSLAVNMILSGRYDYGFRLGRIVELYGPEQSGKTTISLHCIADAQKRGLVCAFIDAENSFDPTYAENIGVDLNSLVTQQSVSGEEVFEGIRYLISAGVKIIVVDSVAALVSKRQMEGEFGDAHIGVKARMMNQGISIISQLLSINNVLLIFINQLRVMNFSGYGNPEGTTGGKALKYYSSYRIEVRSPRKDALKVGKDEIGTKALVKVVKNKTYPPHKATTVSVIYGKGIEKNLDVVEVFMQKNGVENGRTLFNGKKLTRSQLLEYYEDIEKILMEEVG